MPLPIVRQHPHSVKKTSQDHLVSLSRTMGYIPILSAIPAIASIVLQTLAAASISKSFVTPLIEGNILFYELSNNPMHLNILHLIPLLGNIAEYYLGQTVCEKTLHLLRADATYFLQLPKKDQSRPTVVAAALVNNPKVLQYVSLENIQNPAIFAPAISKHPFLFIALFSHYRNDSRLVRALPRKTILFLLSKAVVNEKLSEGAAVTSSSVAAEKSASLSMPVLLARAYMDKFLPRRFLHYSNNREMPLNEELRAELKKFFTIVSRCNALNSQMSCFINTTLQNTELPPNHWPACFTRSGVAIHTYYNKYRNNMSERSSSFLQLITTYFSQASASSQEKKKPPSFDAQKIQHSHVCLALTKLLLQNPRHIDHQHLGQHLNQHLGQLLRVLPKDCFIEVFESIPIQMWPEEVTRHSDFITLLKLSLNSVDTARAKWEPIRRLLANYIRENSLNHFQLFSVLNSLHINLSTSYSQEFTMYLVTAFPQISCSKFGDGLILHHKFLSFVASKPIPAWSVSTPEEEKEANRAEINLLAKQTIRNLAFYHKSERGKKAVNKLPPGIERTVRLMKPWLEKATRIRLSEEIKKYTPQVDSIVYEFP